MGIILLGGYIIIIIKNIAIKVIELVQWYKSNKNIG